MGKRLAFWFGVLLSSCLAAWPAEQTIMNRLRAQTGNWSIGDNATESDACTWTGVTCLFSILFIDLSNRGLSGNFSFSGQLGALNRLDVTNNALTGDVAHIFAMAPNLAIARLGSNQFTGEVTSLPSQLSELDLSSNRLAFDVGSIRFPSGLQYFYIDGNPGLYGTFNESLAACDLYEIYASNVGLGALASNLLTKPHLLTAQVPNTSIAMDFPRTMSSSITRLNLRNNNITGNLSWSLFSPSPSVQLILLDLSGNQLSALVNLPFQNATITSYPLQTLNIARNNLLLDVASLMDGCRALGSLVTLDFSENRVYGDLGDYMLHLPGTNYGGLFIFRVNNPFQNIWILNGSHNKITGPLPNFRVMRSLSTVDLSSNNITGSLPDSIQPVTLRALHLRSTGLRAAPQPRSIPSYLHLDSGAKTLLPAHISCLAVTADPGLVVEFDWDTYFGDDQHCICSDGFVWAFDRCNVCPQNTTCNQTLTTTLEPKGIVNRGSYPVDIYGKLSNADPANLAGQRPVLVVCRHEEFCNPIPRFGRPFYCQEGHDVESLLCSRCSDGYYGIGDQCYLCSGAAILSPIITAFMYVLITIVVLRKQERAVDAGTVQIVLTWVQLTRILYEVNLRNPSTSSVMNDDVVFPALLSLSVLSPMSLECTWKSDYQTDLMFAFFSPLLFLCYAAALVGIFTCVRARREKAAASSTSSPSSTSSSTTAAANAASTGPPTPQAGMSSSTSSSSSRAMSSSPSFAARFSSVPSSRKALEIVGTRIIFIWGFCLFAFFFQFSILMLRAISCEDLAANDKVDKSSFPRPDFTLHVLSHAPYVRCDDDLDISPLGAFGVIYAMMFPPLVVFCVWQVRKRYPQNWREVLAPYIGYLTRHLRKEAFLWDMTMVPARKFLLAIAIACYPRTGMWTVFMPLHVIAVLTVCLVLQAWVRPYALWFDNVLEVFLLAEQLLAFFLVVITVVAGDPNSPYMKGITVFVLVITWVSLVICLLAVFRPSILRYCNKKMGKDLEDQRMAERNTQAKTEDEETKNTEDEEDEQETHKEG